LEGEGARLAALAGMPQQESAGVEMRVLFNPGKGRAMRKVIVDCDPGIDDALAIFLALASQDDVDVLGLTCVKGNVALDQTYRNAQRICAVAGRGDIPVLRGLSRPILAPSDLAASVHGKDGLGDIGLALPEDVPASEMYAVDFIRQQAETYPGEVVLCPIGPMTNVAVAMLLDPSLARKLHSIAFMGGAAFCAGNMNEFAEFNFMADPHAAEIVLRSGARLVMFGLDVTFQVRIEDRHIQGLKRNGNTCSTVAARLLEAYALGDLHLHDPCVIAWLADPTLFSGVQSQVRVVTAPGPEFGRSLASLDPGGNCLVITEVDQARLFDLLLSRLKLLP
jgi:purine nucleosidase